jgi:hypothetical protein
LLRADFPHGAPNPNQRGQSYFTPVCCAELGQPPGYACTILTVGYMVARGIAKAGTRDPYWDERGDRDADH